MDDYAQALARNGIRICSGRAGTIWGRYESYAMARIPTFASTTPSRDEVNQVLTQSRSAVATYLLPPDPAHVPNACLYICRNKSYSLEALGVAARRDARRARRNLTIGFVDWPTVLAKGTAAFCQTRRRVGLSDGTAEDFRTRITRFSANPAHVAVGAWIKDALVAFMTLVVVEDWVEIEGSFSTDEQRGLCPNDGLANFVLHHFLVGRDFTTVSYGLSSIQDPEQNHGLHAYKTKVGFEAQPVHRAFVLHPVLRPLATPWAVRGVSVIRGLFPQNRMIKKAGGMLELLVANGRLGEAATGSLH